MDTINYLGETFTVPIESSINNTETESTITLKLSDYISIMKKLENLEENVLNLSKKNKILSLPKERPPASP